MCALAILLSFIEFPIIPAASFLKLDISLVPSVVVGFTYGTGPGLLCGIACAIAHAIITGNWVGALMNCIVAVAYIVPSVLIYRGGCTMKRAIIGFAVATVCLVLGACIANLIVDPIFYGMPFEVVSALIVPAIVPFNIIKGLVISILSVLVYRSVGSIIAREG